MSNRILLQFLCCVTFTIFNSNLTTAQNGKTLEIKGDSLFIDEKYATCNEEGVYSFLLEEDSVIINKLDRSSNAPQGSENIEIFKNGVKICGPIESKNYTNDGQIKNVVLGIDTTKITWGETTYLVTIVHPRPECKYDLCLYKDSISLCGETVHPENNGDYIVKADTARIYVLRALGLEDKFPKREILSIQVYQDTLLYEKTFQAQSDIIAEFDLKQDSIFCFNVKDTLCINWGDYSWKIVNHTGLCEDVIVIFGIAIPYILLYVLLAVVVIAIGGSVAAWFLLRRKKSKKAPAIPEDGFRFTPTLSFSSEYVGLKTTIITKNNRGKSEKTDGYVVQRLLFPDNQTERAEAIEAVANAYKDYKYDKQITRYLEEVSEKCVDSVMEVELPVKVKEKKESKKGYIYINICGGIYIKPIYMPTPNSAGDEEEPVEGETPEQLKDIIKKLKKEHKEQLKQLKREHKKELDEALRDQERRINEGWERSTETMREEHKQAKDDAKALKKERDTERSLKEAAQKKNKEHEDTIARMKLEQKEYNTRLVFYLSCQDLAANSAKFFELMQQVKQAATRMYISYRDNGGKEMDSLCYYMSRTENKFNEAVSKIANYEAKCAELRTLAGSGLVLKGGWIDKLLESTTDENKRLELLKSKVHRDLFEILAGAAIIMADEYAYQLKGMVGDVNSTIANEIVKLSDALQTIVQKGLGYKLCYARPMENVTKFKNVIAVDSVDAGFKPDTIFEVKTMAVQYGVTGKTTEVTVQK